MADCVKRLRKIEGDDVYILAAANICDRILNSVRCFGHTSRLNVNKALSSVSAVADTLKLVRDLSHYFRRSGPSWQILKDIQRRDIQR